MPSCIIKNSDLIDCWLSAPSNKKKTELYEFVKGKLGDLPFEKKSLMMRISLFNSRMTQYWKLGNYNRNNFEKKYSKWLNWKFYNSETQKPANLKEATSEVVSATPRKRGRPSKVCS